MTSSLLIPFLVLAVVAAKAVEALKCFSCASYEYRMLFERDDVLSRKVRVPKFDRLCDMEDMVQGFAPVDVCHSTCVTIFEPQYFGGLQSLQRPYLYIRGCRLRWNFCIGRQFVSDCSCRKSTHKFRPTKLFRFVPAPRTARTTDDFTDPSENLQSSSKRCGISRLTFGRGWQKEEKKADDSFRSSMEAVLVT
ncbi:unnamed protein product [Caenorhabditis auriculariae]|uniref:Secreted protein n=1 Tax=Caenorhabditis auriculariae TaxID=2777116 RepID=A0A8S1GP30_9PELO|nr:unnamed protein product [Caenorhabditis auriculariae]